MHEHKTLRNKRPPFLKFQPIYKFYLVSLSLCFGLFAQASETYRSVALQNFINQYQSDQKRNHSLCYAFQDETPGLPCNPSLMSQSNGSGTWVYLHGNNNLDYFENVSDILEGPIKVQETLSLLNHNSTEQFQFSGSIGYRNDNWGFSVIPESLILFTHIRNPSLPRLSLLAARESQIQIQVGDYFSQEWSWGLQSRVAFRRLSYNDTFLTEHFIESGSTLYPIESETAVYLEPSLTYTAQSFASKPQFSLMAINAGWSNNDKSPFRQDPNFLASVSSEILIHRARLRWGGLAQWISQPDRQKVYGGAGFEFSIYEYSLYSTLFELEKQIGFALNAQTFTAGISYSEQDWSDTPRSRSQSLWRWDIGFKF